MTGSSARGIPQDPQAARDRRTAVQGTRPAAQDGRSVVPSGRPAAPDAAPKAPPPTRDTPTQSPPSRGAPAPDGPPPRDSAGNSPRQNRPAAPTRTAAAPRDHQPVAHPEPRDAPSGRHHVHHGRTSWSQARLRALQAGWAQRTAPHDHPHLHPAPVPLDHALGLVTAAPLIALTDLPPFDTSAMDGWAVAGPGPWLVRGRGQAGEGPVPDGANPASPTAGNAHRAQAGPGADRAATAAAGERPRGAQGHRHGRTVLAGCGTPEPLDDGQAVRIATGARIPHDATAVIRSEYGVTDSRGQLHATHEVVYGQDIRPRGQECRKGEGLLPGGVLITPAVLGLAAAAGYDELLAAPVPRAEVLILGDELLTGGLPYDGLIRDALGPMLPPWLRALGAEVTAVRRLGDDAGALYRAITESDADLLVTTGGTAAGPMDHVHPTLRRIDAELVVDGVAVRPGHPMLLARTKEHQHLVGLPGNPLAAVSGLLTLAEPFLRALRGLTQPGTDTGPVATSRTVSPVHAPSPSRSADPSHPATTAHRMPSPPSPHAYAAVVRDRVQGHPVDTRLVPVALRSGEALPLHYNGPAMLRGIAAADALAVVPPGGAEAGQELEILDLPWNASGSGIGGAWPVAGSGECFT